MAQLGQAPDVVLVEMGKDRGPDIVCGVAELVQSGAQGLLQADLEPGQRPYSTTVMPSGN